MGDSHLDQLSAQLGLRLQEDQFVGPGPSHPPAAAVPFHQHLELAADQPAMVSLRNAGLQLLEQLKSAHLLLLWNIVNQASGGDGPRSSGVSSKMGDVQLEFGEQFVSPLKL